MPPANDPATEGKDYEAASGTLTFAPGDTSKTFTVTLNDDDVKEKDEAFTIQLSNPGQRRADRRHGNWDHR